MTTSGPLFFQLRDITLKDGAAPGLPKAGVLKLATERKPKTGSWSQEKANGFELRQLLVVTCKREAEPLEQFYWDTFLENTHRMLFQSPNRIILQYNILASDRTLGLSFNSAGDYNKAVSTLQSWCNGYGASHGTNLAADIRTNQSSQSSLMTPAPSPSTGNLLPVTSAGKPVPASHFGRPQLRGGWGTSHIAGHGSELRRHSPSIGSLPDPGMQQNAVNFRSRNFDQESRNEMSPDGTVGATGVTVAGFSGNHITGQRLSDLHLTRKRQHSEWGYEESDSLVTSIESTEVPRGPKVARRGDASIPNPWQSRAESSQGASCPSQHGNEGSALEQQPRLPTPCDPNGVKTSRGPNPTPKIDLVGMMLSAKEFMEDFMETWERQLDRCEEAIRPVQQGSQQAFIITVYGEELSEHLADLCYEFRLSWEEIER